MAASPAAAPPPSALESLIAAYPNPPTSFHPSHHYSLALHIAHNLRYQHNWTDLRIHSTSPLDPQPPLPRPMISGVPPQRLYIHPDEQIALLQQQKDAGKSGMPELRSEREWVLPSHLREKWSLKKFGETFDVITKVPAVAGGEGVFEFMVGSEEGTGEASEWRTEKRVLLATVEDDSTVVYYIVHDGLVKPRQN